MLEVHPPSHTPHSWRDFLIHIATIVVGLLIAVGIEQTVEWVHHRNEIAEVRATLERERHLNARISAVKVEEFARITPRLREDAAVFRYLRDHQGAPARDWPGRISWNSLVANYLDAAWQTAKTGPILGLMPRPEVQRYAELYSRLAGANDASDKFVAALSAARRYTFRTADPANLSRDQIDAELTLIDDVLAAHLVVGRNDAAMAIRFPDFKAPPRADIVALNPGIEDSADRAATFALFTRVQKIKDEAD